MFVTKLSSTGSSLSYSTFLGGSSNDGGKALALDGSGNAFVSGYTYSSNFPTTGGAFSTSYNGGSYDVFVTKLSSTGSSLSYSTYLGGSSGDGGKALALDGSGNAFVSGYTPSSNFPTTGGAFSTSHNVGSPDVFVTKFFFATGDLTPSGLVSSASPNSAQIYTPQVQISNLDSSLTSSATTATIEISFNGNQIYTDTQTVPQIAPISDSTITFASLIPYKSGTYDVVVLTELVGDTDTSNDTLYTSFDAIGDFAINEFLPLPNSSFGNPNLAEFFEIANNTNLAVDISNWTVQNSAGLTITVSNGISVPANSYFVFVAQVNSFLNEGTPVDYDYTSTAFVLDNVTDFLLLKNSTGDVVDSVFYDASWNTTQGEAFERKNVKLDGNDPTNWCLATATYGSGQNKGTPGNASSCFSQLADGALSDNFLDFGSVALLDSAEISLVLYSTGSANLTVDSLTITGTDFTTDLTGISVASGDSSVFSVKFKPATESTVSSSLEIFTNDWNTPSYTVSLSGTGIDGIAPAQISDFTVASNTGTSVKLFWTATGDDSTLGTAASYEIRRSTNELTEPNFSSATLVSNLPTPSASGTADSVTVSGLTSGTQYYFGIKVYDNAGNASPLSTVNNFDRPKITSITDVNNDNGKNVRITFDASFNDFTSGTGMNALGYLILRKVDPNYAPISKNSNQIFETLPSGTWEVLQSIFATGDQSYTTVVPTLADSNATGTHDFDFLVRAVSSVSPTINSISNVVSAHSVDNLAPPAPANPSFADNGNGTFTANWNTVSANDLAFYTIYAQFPDDSYQLVTNVTPVNSATQSYTFSAVTNAVNYFVGCVDENGNESLPPFDRITSLKVEILNGNAVLSWLGKQNATLYKIFRSSTPENTNATQIGTYTPNGIPPTFTDTTISTAQKFFYFIVWEN